MVDRALAATLLVSVLAACSDSSAPVTYPPSDVSLITIETYDGSSQAVHPDPAATPLSWGAAETHLFVTPYPNGDATKENPSLYGGNSFLEWLVPSGVINPLVRPSTGYLSDPDGLFNPETGEVWLYYRAVTSANEIYLIRGSGPASWSRPMLVASGVNHTIVSPTVVRRGDGDWLMWSVNSGTRGCTSDATSVELRRSSDGIHWSSPMETDLQEDNAFAWHIDVEWIPSREEFWATYNIKIAGSCTTAALHFATSVDGIHWLKSPGAVLTRGTVPAFADIVYRASLLYDATSDKVTLWYSGARFEDGNYIWKIATEQLTRTALFARVAKTRIHDGGLAVTGAPPLTDDDAP
jgi:hypothetical protein